MHKHIVLISATLALIFSACSSTKNTGNNVTISGKISNADGGKVYLNKYIDSLSNYFAVDSTEIKNGTYELATHVDSIEFIVINHQNDNPIELIARNDQDIKLSYDINDIPFSVDIKGSEDSYINFELFKFVKGFETTKSGFVERLNALDEKDTTSRKKILAEYEGERSVFQKEKAKLFSQYESSPAILVFLPYLNPENELKYFQQIESVFATNLNNTVWHKYVKKRLADVERYILQLEQYKKQQEAQKNTSIGAEAPEISLNDPDGNIRNLSDLRGKYVLVDFWASWCRPCRAENPNVVRLYNKYKDKGFDIFSVSLDKDGGRWKSAITQDKLTWPNHVSDLLGWNTSVISDYGFSGIPFTVLLDKDGKIIGTNLRGPSLERKLKELFE